MPIKTIFRQTKLFRIWLFLLGTRVIEFLNTIMIIGFSLAFIYDYLSGANRLAVVESYDKLHFGGQLWPWLLFGFIGLAQAYTMACRSIKSNQASGLLLILSGALWACIGGALVASTSVLLAPIPIICLSVALVASLAGCELLNKSKIIESLINEEH